MVVNVNVGLSDEAHKLLEKIKLLRGLKNNSEAVEFAIKVASKKASPP